MTLPAERPSTTSRKEYIDVETGQVHVFETIEPAKTYKRPTENVDEAFVMVFPHGINAFKEHLPGQRMMLLMLLLEAMDPRTGHSTYSTQKLAATLATPDTYVSKMLREMRAAGIIDHIRRGVVAVNPQIGWRGSLSRRRTLLREMRMTQAAAK